MAKELDPEVAKLNEEKKSFKEQQKKEKQEQKARKKEAKKRAKEIAEEEARILDEEPGGIPVFLTTLIIILVWLGILCALIKLDVGGFGSGVLTPVLKDVPIVNRVLPEQIAQEPEDEEYVDVSGYKSLKDAVREIKELEMELNELQEINATKEEQINVQSEEIERLRTFEEKQVEFERIKNEFYNEVVYAENGPGADEYVKYYQTMDPATAEVLYKQVVMDQQEDKLVKNYAQTYSEMKPAEAAAAFEHMTDNLDLVAKILWQMEPDSRGAIFNVMNKDVVAKLTKIMEPDR